MVQPDHPGLGAEAFPDRPILRAGRRLSQFTSKSSDQQRLINDALYILAEFGIPFGDLTPRKMERMAMAFLAVADVLRPEAWGEAKDVHDGWSLKTRDIITIINENFGESIALSSYDDIRRQDLKLCVLAGIVRPTRPGSARNNPGRGYALDGECADCVRAFGTADWDDKVAGYRKDRKSLSEQLSPKRELESIPVKLPSGPVEFSPGKHNELQKAIIEKLLPKYGYGAEVLYVGDAAHRTLVYERERMAQLKLPDLEHGEMPDVIAYCEQRNWLYMIEAVHSSGAIDPARLRKLAEFTSGCTSDVVYVTAFLDKTTFRKFAPTIAWETEVWIAEEPDHLVHFDGEKFLGPYPQDS